MCANSRINTFHTVWKGYPVFLTLTNFPALRLLKCGWRWPKPGTGLQQFCQLRISKVGPLSPLHGVTSGCCLQEKKGCQFPLSRRPQWPAFFSCLWARMDSLCVACVYMQQFTWGRGEIHRDTETALYMCASAHCGSWVFTKTTKQNWSKCNFHFCHSEGKKNVSPRNFVWFL